MGNVMGHQGSSELVISKAADIVIAYLGVCTVDPDRLASLVQEVRLALQGDGSSIVASGASPAPIAFPAEVDPGEESGRTAPAAAIVEHQPAEQRRPPVPIAESVTRDHIVCLEDGKRYRSLRRHLMAKYQMTPDDYRRKWGLPRDYPMVAPSYAEERSQVAKRSGLGGKASGAEQSAPQKPLKRGGVKVAKA
jgi:predicted transcriptional regulator